MSVKWALNASPLIVLAKVGQAELPAKLADELVIPASVADEIEAGPAGDPAREWLQAEGHRWIRPDPSPVLAVARWDLGAGESAVLSYAHHHRDFEAILDDRAARKCAIVERIPVRGSLGVILTAKVRGLIPSAKPVCDALVQAGFRIAPEVLRGALSLVGE